MDIRLDGKAAIVTGAGRGIGEGIAASLASHGARVLCADIDEGTAAATAGRLRAAGGEAAAVRVDVADSVSVRAMVDRCLALWGSVDILVNNAGAVTTQLVEDLPEADWRRVLDVNLTGPFLCAQAVLPAMRRQGSGKIVNISSNGAKRISFNGAASYTASKEGLLGLTRHLAYEVARDGINVNAICPGTTETPLEKQVAHPGYLAERTRLIPRGRLATFDDTANAVLYLVSEYADYVNGVALDVDGGSLLGWVDVETYLERRRRPRTTG